MSVKIRMTRMGRRHRPFFRINAIDSRAPRDGRILDKIGHYDPMEKKVDDQIVLDTEKAQKWLDAGAIPSDSVADILAKFNITCPYTEKKKARRDKARTIARAKGVPFTKPEKIAAAKAKVDAIEAAKAAEEAAAKAAEEAAAAKAAAAEEAAAAKAAE